MTVVSSKEFVANQKRYFDMAVNENILIRRGKNWFQLVYKNEHNAENANSTFLEPDEDLRNAITMDELLEKTYGVIHKFFANK